MIHPLLTGPEFGVQAACAQVGGDGWFPDKGSNGSRDARAVCAGCEVQVKCLEWALANNERFGIWGGLTERERRPLVVARRPRKLPPIDHGTEAGARTHWRRHEKPCEPCLEASRVARRNRHVA